MKYILFAYAYRAYMLIPCVFVVQLLQDDDDSLSMATTVFDTESMISVGLMASQSSQKRLISGVVQDTSAA